MWDWLWHLRGSVRIEAARSDELVIARVEELFARQRKSISFQGPDYVEFDSPLWEDIFGPNWLALVVYDRGRVWIDRQPEGRLLRYDLRSLHGFVFCLFGAVMFFAFGAVAGNPQEGLKLAAIAFGWLYGGNVALALLRIPSKFKRIAQN